jgi:hypothetical protein
MHDHAFSYVPPSAFSFSLEKGLTKVRRGAQIEGQSARVNRLVDIN